MAKNLDASTTIAIRYACSHVDRAYTTTRRDFLTSGLYRQGKPLVGNHLVFDVDDDCLDCSTNLEPLLEDVTV